jgi:6-phosphogluconolactonase
MKTLADPEIHRFDTATALYAKGAELFQKASVESVRDRGAFSVALAGGSTPKGMYSLMADDGPLRSAIPWPQVDFFWTDERHVPPDHPDSNFRMAYEAMLSKVPVRAERVHRVRSENPDASVAAAQYEDEVQSAIRADDDSPRLDLVLLGMGADGHTASLFPGTPALSERTRLVVANWVQPLHAWRITMTLPLINAARLVVILITGADKAERVREALQPAEDGQTLPVQLVRPNHGRLVWLLDREAASLLDEYR